MLHQHADPLSSFSIGLGCNLKYPEATLERFGNPRVTKLLSTTAKYCKLLSQSQPLYSSRSCEPLDRDGALICEKPSFHLNCLGDYFLYLLYFHSVAFRNRCKLFR